MVDNVRCSDWTRLADVDPIGSAPTARSFVLVDRKLPWPTDIPTDPGLTTTLRRLDLADARVVSVVPLTEPRRAAPAFVCWSAAGDRGGFVRTAHDTAGRTLDTSLMQIDESVECEQGQEVLVCTHGSRDRCCGSLGTRLAAELDLARVGLRVRRCSHLGGHRFAPTLLHFPTGTAWAYMTLETMDRLSHRSGDLDALLKHYRGPVGVAPPVQAVDRAVFKHIGWDLLDAERTSVISTVDTDTTAVMLRADLADGSSLDATAIVRSRSDVATIECGGQGSRVENVRFIIEELDIARSDSATRSEGSIGFSAP